MPHDYSNMSNQSSDLASRYHPAIWMVAGLTLAYTSYRLLESYTSLQSTDLRRSNAVHRPRRNRQEGHVDWESPSPGAPLGTILIRKDDETLAINLANTRLPSADMLRRMYGSGSESIRREMQSLALDMILSNCFASIDDAESRARLSNFGLDEVLAALRSRDGEAILQSSYSIPQIMHLDTVTRAQVERAIHTLLTSDPWFTANASGSDDEVVDPAETEDWEVDKNEPSQGLRGLLYYIAENEAKRKAYEHRGIGCEECGELPIRGVRWHCLNCPDFDLCSSCETHSRHPKTHVFAKIKIPVPVLSQPTQEIKLWYPGDPRKIHASLDANLRKKLCQEYDYEEPQLDALYDQFTCLANVPWERDPTRVKAGMDRRAFNRAMTSERWPAGLATNAMFDRMFAFYDTDNNGIIGLEEFVDGMAYLRGPKRFASLRRTIQGYDLDGDGYVDRKDFLRILRAKHIIQKQLISDQVDFLESERILMSQDVLRSNQPISSLFADEQIPPGETRPPGGKRPDAFGDMQPLPGTKTILDEHDPFVRKRPPRERLRATLSRFEELLNENDMSQQDNDGSEEDTGVREILPDAEDDIEDPYLQDILWQITENGFNELLDPLFRTRELNDQEIADTRAERKQWASEIEDAIAVEARSRQKEMEELEASKPSQGSTNETSSGRKAPDLPERAQPETFSDGIVPTDWVSLSRREAEIADAPLDELLNNLGYGLRDDDATITGSDVADSDPRIADSGSSTIWNGRPASRATSPLKTAIAANDEPTSTDPTLPQNRPTADSAEGSSKSPAPAKAPSKSRLNKLAQLNDLEREMEERGGPGRLAYDEVEHIVVADEKHELRGLVKSWLEWASF
ncbi:hypothetical protein CB0940_01993 [Cercospora beticola]|uniref:Uncharacterized protein n=2 Tax=Cercospora beticola TaxID=122368 RepID=A0A2G5IAV2_CERBT|nr:hypothetical protein CB0940_01993 [Cercospora beticola]PIB01901.1 hypothetical protein CB0940_01993 [Cercospora beticola]CAK1354100.1 unnamed protein product [Cercospora beticola]